METCIHVQELVNKELKIGGILRCMIDTRRTDNRALVELVEEEYSAATKAAGDFFANGFLFGL